MLFKIVSIYKFTDYAEAESDEAAKEIVLKARWELGEPSTQATLQIRPGDW